MSRDRRDFVTLLAAGVPRCSTVAEADAFASSALALVKERFPDEPASNRILSEDEIDALMSATHYDDDEGDDDATFAMLQHTEQELETAQRELAAATARANRYREALVEAVETADDEEFSDIARRADADVAAMGAEAGAAAPVGDGRPNEASTSGTLQNRIREAADRFFARFENEEEALADLLERLDDGSWGQHCRACGHKSNRESDHCPKCGRAEMAMEPELTVPAPSDGVERVVLDAGNGKCDVYRLCPRSGWISPAGGSLSRSFSRALDEILAQRKRAKAAEKQVRGWCARAEAAEKKLTNADVALTRVVDALYEARPWPKDEAPDPVNIIQEMTGHITLAEGEINERGKRAKAAEEDLLDVRVDVEREKARADQEQFRADEREAELATLMSALPHWRAIAWVLDGILRDGATPYAQVRASKIIDAARAAGLTWE